MKNKYLAFAKNLGLSAVAALAAGAGAAELASRVTNNKTVIGIVSGISEYLAAYGVFLPLHAKDNYDIYKDSQGNFKWREFIKDQLKLAGGFVTLDVLYLIGKPILTRLFLQAGNDPAVSSLYADLICIGSLGGLSVPIGKITGNIRSKKPTIEDVL